MANGGHLLLSGDYDRLFHYEENIGLGRFPVAMPGFSFSAPYNFSAISLDDIWVTFNIRTGTTAHQADWDGAQWTSYTYFNTTGESFISAAGRYNPALIGSNAVYVGMLHWLSPQADLAKFNGTTFVQIYTSWNTDKGIVPLAISDTECLFVGWNGGTGVRFHRWTSGGGNVQYGSGGDLPNGFFRGITTDGTDIFLLYSNGDVYRGTWSGSWVLDNSSDGPFSGMQYAGSLEVATDLSTIICANGTNFWVRNGPDDWTNIGPTAVGNQGQPALVGDASGQIAAVGSENETRYTSNGGSTWNNLGGNISERATFALEEEISDPYKRIYVLQRLRNNPWAIWHRGDAKYSPWAQFPFSTETQGTFIDNHWAIEGFPTGELVVSLDESGGYNQAIWHYDPGTTVWTRHDPAGDIAFGRLHGTEYAAGKIHAVGLSTTLRYGRWNGTSWDVSAIAGSGGTSPQHIRASTDGQHIWISATTGSQLQHSSDGGSTWTNRHAAAAAVHSDANQARDIMVVSPTEVWVSFTATPGPGVRFSKWDGVSWSVGAPDINEAISDWRSLYIDPQGDLWCFTQDNGAGGCSVYKLVGGAWSLIQTLTHTHNPYGIEAFENNKQFALCTGTPTGNHIDTDDADLGLGWLVAITGSSNLPNNDIWRDLAKFEAVDTLPPIISNKTPAPGETNVSDLQDLEFDITEDQAGIVISGLAANTIKIWVNGLLVWTAGAAAGGWSGFTSAITNGLHFTLIPPTAYRTQEVTVIAYA